MGPSGLTRVARSVLTDTMRLLLPTLAVPLAVLALSGCAGRRIPGTDIKDNADTRAVVAAIDAYRQAAERRDAGAVLALVSPKYFDDAGTPDPGDDVDYGQLKKRITDDYQRITALRLDMGVKRIDVEGDKASAYVFYDEHYRIATKAGEVAKQASDQHRMLLVREGGAWKFVSGL
jgi:ketosteroid isomerase-like protein